MLFSRLQGHTWTAFQGIVEGQLLIVGNGASTGVIVSTPGCCVFML
jgi:hypothetical protein